MRTERKVHVAVRLDKDFAARIDAVAAKLSTETLVVPRSEALRAVILLGLEVYEGRQAKASSAAN